MERGTPDDTLPARWAALGRTVPVALDAVELWTVELPFRAAVRTARGTHRTRPLVLVHLAGRALDADRNTTEAVGGWGECAALADATFDAEDVERSLAVLRHVMVPALVSRSERAGRPGGPRGRVGTAPPDRRDGSGGLLPPPSDLEAIRQASPHAPLAFAALEMAVADAHLRAERRSLAELLGVEGAQVELGAVVGQADSTDQLVDTVGALVEQGYRRVKLKIGPRSDLEPVAAVRAAFPELMLQVDANGSYRSGDEAAAAEPLDAAWSPPSPGSPMGAGSAEPPGPSDLPEHSATELAELHSATDIPALMGLDHFGLLCIEQPFERSDLASHAFLAGRMATPICLDESLDSPGAVDEALALGACSVVCVKPSRLGGLGATLEVIDGCAAAGVPLWMGGMFESGFARGVITTLGALDGMAWPGDLSPARSYLDDDLVPDRPSFRERGTGRLVTSLPPGPGMGPPPDPDALARLGARHQVIGGAGG